MPPGVALAALIARSMRRKAHHAVTVALTVVGHRTPRVASGDHDIDVPVDTCVQSSGKKAVTFSNCTLGDSICDAPVGWEDKAPATFSRYWTMDTQCVCKLALVPSRNQLQPALNCQWSVQRAVSLFIFPQEPHHFLSNMVSNRPQHLPRPL